MTSSTWKPQSRVETQEGLHLVQMIRVKRNSAQDAVDHVNALWFHYRHAS